MHRGAMHGFHYGRWVFVGGGGDGCGTGVRRGSAGVCAALVAWVGGPSFGVAVGIGGDFLVGWFPLGPREVFVPGYRYSPPYVERINVTNTVIVIIRLREYNVTNVTYVNRGVVGAVTARCREAHWSPAM